THAELPGRRLSVRLEPVEDVLAVLGSTGAHDAVREEHVQVRRLARGRSIPELVRDPPPLEVPEPVVFEGQLGPALAADLLAIERGEAVGGETGTLPQLVHVTERLLVKPQLVR